MAKGSLVWNLPSYRRMSRGSLSIMSSSCQHHHVNNIVGKSRRITIRERVNSRGKTLSGVKPRHFGGKVASGAGAVGSLLPRFMREEKTWVSEPAEELAWASWDAAQSRSSPCKWMLREEVFISSWGRGRSVKKQLNKQKVAPRSTHPTISIHPSFKSCIHSFLHSFIPSFLHSFIHSFFHSLIYSFIHLFIPSFIQSSTHSFIHSLIQSFGHSVGNAVSQPVIHSAIQPFSHSAIQSFSPSTSQPFSHSCIHSFMHSFIHPSFLASVLPSFLPSFLHSFHFFIHSFIHSFLYSTHLLSHSFNA